MLHSQPSCFCGSANCVVQLLLLTTSPRNPVPKSGTDLISHLEADPLRLSYETFALPDDGHRVVVHLPADEATASALDRLDERQPGALGGRLNVPLQVAEFGGVGRFGSRA
ncbi:hypothetical protein [Streptomyces sp. NBC_00996]|uniref:hypothetical protein n=1 Tax=Streptomyces sp. NBC_00996 TaxID=2903710 RepID=UPI00386F0708